MYTTFQTQEGRNRVRLYLEMNISLIYYTLGTSDHGLVVLVLQISCLPGFSLVEIGPIALEFDSDRPTIVLTALGSIGPYVERL